MTTPTPFTVIPGADDVACVDGVCAVPAPAAGAAGEPADDEG